MNKLKKAVFTFSIITMLAVTLFAGALIEFFHASSDGENVTLTWQTTQESNVKEFVIMRGASRENMTSIEAMTPKGSNSLYTYIDENAYKTANSFYVYRLKIVDQDNSVSYSGYVSVTHQVSSVKRTWGSIKALFR